MLIRSSSITSERRRRRRLSRKNSADQIFRRCKLCNVLVTQPGKGNQGRQPEYCTDCVSLPRGFKKRPRFCGDCGATDPTSGWAAPFCEMLEVRTTKTGRTREVEVIVLLCNQCYDDWCNYYQSLDSSAT